MVKIDKNPAYIKRWATEQARRWDFRSDLDGQIAAARFAIWMGDYEHATGEGPFLGLPNMAAEGWTSMHLAVWNMHVETVRSFLSLKSGKVWKGLSSHFTLLHIAVRNNDTETLQVLLDWGAPVDFENGVGRTAFHEAALCGNLEAARALLEAGADVNKVDAAGKRPADYLDPRHRDILLGLPDVD
jgi:hypothetical protein